MPELRRELDISQLTLERAYETLEARGLIERIKGKGVFVVDRLRTGEFAIVARPAILWAQNPAPFFRTVIGSLISSLQNENPNWQVGLHVGKQPRTDAEYPASLDLLHPSVLPRLRGVFSFSALYGLEDALTKAEVPVVYLGRVRGPNSIGFAVDEDFIRPALAHLREAGCRSVGAIVHSLPVGTTFVQKVFAEAREQGLHCEPEWVDPVPAETLLVERVGYESFMRLWGSRTRPDGLLVQDDVLCNGVLRGTLQLGLKMPRDLRLITYANRDAPIDYHLPVTRLEFDVYDLARRAYEMMMQLLRNQTPPQRPILLHGRMIKGETT